MEHAVTYVVVGRSRDCDVVVDDATVSARHARLRWDGDAIAVEDLGSANGTFVDGAPIYSARIRPGDEVALGRVSLPWSDVRMRAFLRAGPEQTTARSDSLRGRALWGRRFVCGVCRIRGLLPPGFASGELLCSACGARLVLGARRSRTKWRRALVAGGALVMGALAVLLAVLAPGGAPWSRLQRALGLTSERSHPRVSSPEEASIRARIAPRIAAAIDPIHPMTRNLAVRIASSAEGPFRIEQVARVWSHVRRQWHYVSDPRGGEYFARASETIENGMAGDCDDFATVIIAMLQSIGGQARMVMVDGDDGGHAYAEVCIAAPPDDVASRLAAFYRRDDVLERASIGDIHFRSDATCPVWLNLDWNARAPGGPYGRERWAVSIGADGSTATLPPAPGDLPNGAPSAVVLPIAAPEGE